MALEEVSKLEKKRPIIVGTFGRKVNIDNKVRNIQSHGLEFFTHELPSRRLTRVGFKIISQSIERDFSYIQDNIEHAVWILE